MLRKIPCARFAALLLFGDFSDEKLARLAPDGAASPQTPSPLGGWGLLLSFAVKEDDGH
jgi:hypothetical protein